MKGTAIYACSKLESERGAVIKRGEEGVGRGEVQFPRRC